MNIRTLALALAIMPAIASAQDNNSDKDTISNKNTYDTTIVFNKQKYEISQTGERTNVKVYKANGSELEKTLETQYLDGQQVEQGVYNVTLHSQKNVQTQKPGIQPLSRNILRFEYIVRLCIRCIISWHIYT